MTPIQIARELPAAFALFSGVSPWLFSLMPVVAVILFQTTIFLLVGLAVAHFVSPQRLALLSLIYRSLLVGLVLIAVAAVSPIKFSIPAVRPLLNLSLLPSQLTPAIDAVPLAQNALDQTPSKEVVSSDLAASPVKALEEVPGTTPLPASPGGLLVSRSQQLGAVLIAIWLVVAGVKLIWLLLAGIYTARLRRGQIINEADTLHLLQQSSAQLKVSTPALVSHSLVQIPFLSGLLRPVIVLPTQYQRDFDATALKAILVHELAHLSRRDCWWKHLSGLIGAVLWFQPLVWVLRQRLEQVDESLCDESVLRGGCSARSYASLLLDLSERLTGRPREQIAGAGIVTRSSLGQRVQRIMEKSNRMGVPVSSLARLVTLVTVMGTVTTVLTLLTVNAAPQKPTPAQSNYWLPKEEYQRITRDNTPEEKVGLPASLKEAETKGNATITGRVLYTNGKPVVGVKITVYNQWLSQTELWGYKRNQSNHYRWPDKIDKLLSGTAVTQADGSYRFTGLLPERYGVRVQGDRLGNRAPSGLLAPYRGVRVIAVANKSTKASDTVLRRAAQICIKAVDGATGAPLEGLLWSGFNIDEAISDQPRSRFVTAHGEMRPMKWYYSSRTTDKNGLCVLSLDEGKANFFMNGGDRMGSTGKKFAKDSRSRFALPDLIITSQGVYKEEEWCEVKAPGQASRRAWKGDTDVVLKKGQVVNFTIKLKRYRALTAEDRRILDFWTNRSRQGA